MARSRAADCIAMAPSLGLAADQPFAANEWARNLFVLAFRFSMLAVLFAGIALLFHVPNPSF
jgi:hypothetical protein